MVIVIPVRITLTEVSPYTQFGALCMDLLTSVLGTWVPGEAGKSVIKVDPVSGLCEFPPPGDARYHTLPVLKDPDAERQAAPMEQDKQLDKEYWMPDKFCKVCFACEDSFTMYRRRHHCRICGQVFCNPCSSFYVDGELINLSGSVRACEMCYKHLVERGDLDVKPTKQRLDGDTRAADSKLESVDARKAAKVSRHEDYLAHIITPAFLEGKIEKIPVSGPDLRRTVLIGESVKEMRDNLNHLQTRASLHMKSIVQYLLRLNKGINNADQWGNIIVSLINSVVTSVDPDVRAGDKLDIRPFVKLKSIPGGSISESTYVEGVVFRKNVAHKKMVYNKDNPKILILAGGIEFHRQDFRMSSLDTLIDQEDKFLEIMVEKIMSLSPDIILVGKSVSRRAQELLSSHQVVVFQHVKEKLLERIARMTHAMMLPSIDHMIQQYGKECLGSCGTFSLSQLETSAGGAIADDNLTRIGNGQTRPRITSIVTGTTYVYLDGCEPRLGCTLVLRGARKPELKQVKHIIRFCVMVAYHLRLEVAYLADRCVQLPLAPDDEQYPDDSDREENLSEYCTQQLPSGEDNPFDLVSEVMGPGGKFRRYLLSQSLDVDVGLPYRSELRLQPASASKKLNNLELYARSLSPLEHQTLNISSILMSEGHNQRGRPEIKSIEFYTELDVPLGQFVVESCFHMVGSGRAVGSKINMLEHTLSFVHRPGRIDIATFKAEGIYGPGFEFYYHHNHASQSHSASHAPPVNPESEWELRDYLRNVQLKMSSYCKVCNALVTPDVTMSDETWKMSFGKFLEMNFYNRSARCRTGGCHHTIRDNHVLFVFCDEGYIARFEFHPIHPFTISLRQKMPMPVDFHNNLNIGGLDRLTQIKETVVEDFRLGIALVEKLAKESLAEYPLALELALSDISAVRKLVSAFDTSQSEEIMKLMNEFMCVNAATTGILELEQDSSESKIGTPLRLTAKAETSTVTAVIDGSIQKLSLKCKFPAVIKRDMFMRSLLWRHHLKKIHDYIEALRARYAQPPIPPASTPSTGAKAQGEGVFSADPPVSSADEVDVKSIRDLYMNDATSLPYSSKIARGEEGILDEAIEDIEDAAIKFVLSPAMSTVRASVNTVVTIGQTAATIGQMLTPAGLISADNTMDTGADGTDRKSFSNEVVKEHSSMLGDLDKRDHHKSVTRIGKLKTKLLGKDSSASASGSFNNEFSEGRLGLPAGRAGIVLEVHEEELATVIAYSLASVEYEQKVSEYLQQAELLTNSTGDGVLPDVEHRGPAVSSVIAADTPGIQVTSRMQSITRGDRSTSRASVDDFGGSPQSAVGEIQGQYDDEDDYRHEGEVTDIHLTDDPTYAIAGERLGAAFKEGGDELAVEQTPRLAGLDSESNSAVFGFSGNEAKDIVGDGLNEMGRFENVDTESRNNRSRVIEKQLSSQRKSHIKHRFIDDDEKGSASCKFICHTFWACQFEALRAAFLEDDGDEGYIRSLGASAKWQAQGGKSGASFSKTLDGRFVVKYITRTELQMFLDFAPAYFEYMQKVFFLGLPTFLCKVLGVYQIGYHNRITGKKVMEQVVVMENLFFERNITRIFDLKGSARNRHVDTDDTADTFETLLKQRRMARKEGKEPLRRPPATQVLMDHNLMELTDGKPLPLKFKANVRFHKAILNDTLFLSIINVVDYSILVGIDEDTQELVVGIIDYMRQYDIIKRMERMGKSVGMIAGQAEPTVIQPVQYRKRFVAAMDKYFMAVPDKWSQLKG